MTASRGDRQRQHAVDLGREVGEARAAARIAVGEQPSRRARALELALQGAVTELESAGLGGSDHEPAELESLQVGQLRAQLLVEAEGDRVDPAHSRAGVRPHEEGQIARRHLGRVDPIHDDVAQLVGVDWHLEARSLRALEAEQAYQRVSERAARRREPRCGHLVTERAVFQAHRGQLLERKADELAHPLPSVRFSHRPDPVAPRWGA